MCETYLNGSICNSTSGDSLHSMELSFWWFWGTSDMINFWGTSCIDCAKDLETQENDMNGVLNTSSPLESILLGTNHSLHLLHQIHCREGISIETNKGWYLRRECRPWIHLCMYVVSSWYCSCCHGTLTPDLYRIPPRVRVGITIKPSSYVWIPDRSCFLVPLRQAQMHRDWCNPWWWVWGHPYLQFEHCCLLSTTASGNRS